MGKSARYARGTREVRARYARGKRRARKKRETASSHFLVSRFSPCTPAPTPAAGQSSKVWNRVFIENGHFGGGGLDGVGVSALPDRAPEQIY